MIQPADEAARLLRERAASYANDASTLRHMGDTDEAIIYETVASELRQAADGIEGLATACRVGIERATSRVSNRGAH